MGGVRAHSWPPCARTLQFSTALQVARLLGWTAGQDIGMDDSYAPMRGRYRSPMYRRLSHGLMMRQAELGTRDEGLRDLAAWRLVLPPDAVFTHVTAAWLFDWWLPSLPEYVPTFAATTASTRPRRAGLTCSRLDTVAVQVHRYGIPVDHPAEVLLRAARDLAVLDLVVLMDAALARSDVEVDELRALAFSRRPGSRRLRAALELSDGRSESAWESLLRVFHQVAETGRGGDGRSARVRRSGSRRSSTTNSGPASSATPA